MPVRLSAALCLILIVFAAVGCTSHAAKRPALISHMVFVTLNDASLIDTVIEDCDRELTTIPGVVAYAAGPHVDTGRDNVDGNYDIGLYIGFDSLDAYATYVDHPQHVGILSKWGSAVTSLRIHDVIDDTK